MKTIKELLRDEAAKAADAAADAYAAAKAAYAAADVAAAYKKQAELILKLIKAA